FSALDAGSRAGTRQAVADALRGSGATALLVTHDQGEALSMGNRVGVLRRGVLAQFATPDELYRRPADPELAAFVGEAVLLDASCAGAVADTPLGRIPLHPGAPDGPARILLRPEQIAISPPGTGNPEAVVASVAYYGHDAGVVLALSAVPETRLAARINGTEALALRAGDRVSLTVNGTATAFPSG
ncbi:MAG: TOBE domain-containing protein, partial [Gluconacetobacter diazotrophicus]|nr:TOBE domain-containing protein [Gluconacetobacter diazotrophicus]